MSTGITVNGIERLRLKAQARADVLKGSEMRAILNKAGDDLVEAYKNKIQSFNPGSVTDLAESTKKQKMRKVGFVYPILMRTSQMMNSMFVTVRAPRSGGWILALGFKGSQGRATNAQIADAHINGTSRVPKRDFTKIPAAWRDSLFRRIRDAIRKR